jgi:hypothetical protein
MSDAGSDARSQLDIETVQQRTEACEKLVDNAIAGLLPPLSLFERLKEAGATPEEAQDYINDFVQRRDRQGGSANPGEDPLLDHNDLPSQVDATTAIAWATLRAKVAQLQPFSTQEASNHNSLSDEIEKLLGVSTKGSIPASVLAKAPHLSQLSNTSNSDGYLESTQDLLAVYSPQASQDILVAKAPFAPVSEPLPRTIWRKILLDQFIDFEKLFASMDKGYDHHDDPKDFGGGYALVKKEQAFTKRPLRSESDWIRVFDAWSAGVIFFFCHREDELRRYRSIVMDVFRAAPSNPLVAIQFDVEVRDKYAKKPFRLDDRDQLNLPLLAQMFRAPSSATSSRPSKHVMPASSSGSPTKRSDVPCRNWSFGSCTTDPCPNRRKHGICCICGAGHRAKDNERCFSILQTRN